VDNFFIANQIKSSYIPKKMVLQNFTYQNHFETKRAGCKRNAKIMDYYNNCFNLAFPCQPGDADPVQLS